MKLVSGIFASLVLLSVLVASLVVSAADKAESKPSLPRSAVAPVTIEPAVLEHFATMPTQVVIVSIRQSNDSSERPPSVLSHKHPLPMQRAKWQQFSQKKHQLLTQLQAIAPVTMRRSYDHLPLVSLEISPLHVEALRNSSLVSGVFFNGKSKPNLATSLPFVGVPTVHANGNVGAGTAVAVLDSPVRYWNGHFGDCEAPGVPGCSIAAWENFTTDDHRSVADGEAHGTNVCGIVLGVAPKTKILSLNVFRYDSYDRQYYAWFEDQMDAIDWVVAHKEEYNIVAINMSLGSPREDPAPCNFDGYYDAFKELWDLGIIAAVSSGNDFVADSIGTPACVSLVMSVGAQFDRDLKAFPGDFEPTMGIISQFTNLNGDLDIVGPGLWVDAGGIDDYTGTSMSAPHVAGSVALMQSVWKAAGGYLDAPWAWRNLKIMALPRHHSDEYIYSQLNVDSSLVPDFTDAFAFTSYLREDINASIPQAPKALSFTFDYSPDQPLTIKSLYLLTQVIHPVTRDVEITLTAPDGTAVTVKLPGIQQNFNGVLGRIWQPGAFTAFDGVDAAGEWTIEYTDKGGNHRGNYLNATLYFVAEDCTAQCEFKSCGDDGCGGSCGSCDDGSYCSTKGQCVVQGQFCAGDNCLTAIDLPIVPTGQYAGSTLECGSFTQGTCGGLLVSEQVYRIELDHEVDLTAQVDGFDSVVYIGRGNECEDLDILACNDDMNAGNFGSKIKTPLMPGVYYLVVDGNFQRGDYTMSVDMCIADCGDQECGTEPCGRNCGACDRKRVCSTEGKCLCEFATCGDNCCDNATKVCVDEATGKCGCEYKLCGGVCCAKNETCSSTGFCAPKPEGCTSGGVSLLMLLGLLALVWRRQSAWCL